MSWSLKFDQYARMKVRYAQNKLYNCYRPIYDTIFKYNLSTSSLTGRSDLKMNIINWVNKKLTKEVTNIDNSVLSIELIM